MKCDLSFALTAETSDALAQMTTGMIALEVTSLDRLVAHVWQHRHKQKDNRCSA